MDKITHFFLTTTNTKYFIIKHKNGTCLVFLPVVLLHAVRELIKIITIAIKIKLYSDERQLLFSP